LRSPPADGRRRRRHRAGETRNAGTRLRSDELPVDEANAVGAVYEDEDEAGGGADAGLALNGYAQQHLLDGGAVAAAALEPSAKRQKLADGSAFAAPELQGLVPPEALALLGQQQAALVPGLMPPPDVPAGFVPAPGLLPGMVPVPGLLPPGMIPVAGQPPVPPAPAPAPAPPPPAARPARRRASGRTRHDDEEEDEDDPQLTQNVLAMLRRSDSQHSSGATPRSAAGRTGSLGRSHSTAHTPGGANSEQLRAKAREQLAAALARAVEELKSEGHDEALAEPGAVAAEVELALFKLEGARASPWAWLGRRCRSLPLPLPSRSAPRCAPHGQHSHWQPANAAAPCRPPCLAATSSYSSRHQHPPTPPT
jgi:hypothetical protein